MNLTRLNVNLNEETADALKTLAEGRGLSLTEVVRRAISLYWFFSNEMSQGHTVQVRNPETSEVREVMFL